MNVDKIVRVGALVAVVGAGIWIYDEVSTSPEEEAARQAVIAAEKAKDRRISARLKRVLQLTMTSAQKTEERVERLANILKGNDKIQNEGGKYAFGLFAKNLENALNQAEPPFLEGPEAEIGLAHTKGLTIAAFHDKGVEGWNRPANPPAYDDDEILFVIEVDGENGRFIATDAKSNAVETLSFTQAQRASGGLMTGFLIGHMWSRQGMYGNPNALKSKSRATPAQGRARGRSGSGSHMRGK